MVGIREGPAGNPAGPSRSGYARARGPLGRLSPAQRATGSSGMRAALAAHVRDGAEGALAVQQRLERVRVRVHNEADDDHVVAGGDELVGAAHQPLALASQPGGTVIHVPGDAGELVGALPRE